MVARIATVRATTGETPMLSANDRSRWCTVRTLVDEGTYAIDSLVQIRHPETKRRFWKTIDMVRHRGPDGREHYYSSKPPLFPTLLAGEYWLIRQATGMTLADQPFQVMRWMLVITNVLPLLLYFYVLLRCVEQVAVTQCRVVLHDDGRYLGYVLDHLRRDHQQPFAGGHLGTVGLRVGLAHLERRDQLVVCSPARDCWRRSLRPMSCRRWRFSRALPCWSCGGPRGGRCSRLRRPPQSWRSGFFVTNYLAHGTWVPAYGASGRRTGRRTRWPWTAARELDQQVLPASVREELGRAGVPLSDQTSVLVHAAGHRWAIWDRVGAHRYAAVATTDAVEIRRWDNWYDYEGSYWSTARQGVDRGESSPWVYALQAVLGHHGIFSLTPIWLLSVWGAVAMVRGRPAGFRVFGWMVIAVTAVCLLFYLSRPAMDRNYGGVSCGFRWMFWFIPLWLICLVPAADRLLQRRWGRAVALLLLAISVFSATYSAANPWSHPWLWQWGEFAGWWQY